jgi:hypothetical protein
VDQLENMPEDSPFFTLAGFFFHTARIAVLPIQEMV